MTQLKLIEKQPGYFIIEGKLTFSSINKKTVKSLTFSDTSDKVCIDLEKVESTDSAGLALMIEWIKHSKIRGTQVAFKNIPEQLLTLAKLSGFDTDEYFPESKQ